LFCHSVGLYYLLIPSFIVLLFLGICGILFSYSCSCVLFSCFFLCHFFQRCFNCVFLCSCCVTICFPSPLLCLTFVVHTLLPQLGSTTVVAFIPQSILCDRGFLFSLVRVLFFFAVSSCLLARFLGLSLTLSSVFLTSVGYILSLDLLRLFFYLCFTFYLLFFSSFFFPSVYTSAFYLFDTSSFVFFI